jgi:hypothetical protein
LLNCKDGVPSEYVFVYNGVISLSNSPVLLNTPEFAKGPVGPVSDGILLITSYTKFSITESVAVFFIIKSVFIGG